MKILFDAAPILTQSMRKGKKLKFARSFDNISDATELARSAEQANQIAGTLPKTTTHHHNLTIAVSKSRQEKNNNRLVSSIQSFTNPFSEERFDLYNLLTKVVMPGKVKKDRG